MVKEKGISSNKHFKVELEEGDFLEVYINGEVLMIEGEKMSFFIEKIEKNQAYIFNGSIAAVNNGKAFWGNPKK